MSHYKKNANASRDALFGGAGSGGGSSSKPTTGRSSSSSSASRPTTTTTPAARTANTARGYTGGATKKASARPNLSAEAKAAKLKEAEENKEKANKAMQRTFFNRPDPVAASTYYKRAAECFQAVGDDRLERYYRLSSGDCNLQCGAWASAAFDFTRAAELMLVAEDVTDHAVRRRDAASYHKKAAEAWKQMNEKSKAATSLVQAAIALNHGEEGTMLSKEALVGMEEAVEAFVPDVFNHYARYRQTGHSAFIDPDSEETIENPSAEAIAMANEHMVSRSYAHEPLQELTYTLVGFGEYASALYATGAASKILEKDGISTLSLGRSYVIETILTLAMGDPIAAEQNFLNRHCQSTPYLSSRECKLAEDLFRAVKMRDTDALEEARSPSGSNRAALANLNECMRTLAGQLRTSGVARKVVGDTVSSSSQFPASEAKQSKSNEPEPASLQELMSKKTGYEQEAEEGKDLDPNALNAELDALDFLDSDKEDEEIGDDDFDLR